MAEYPALPLWTDAFLGDTLHLSAEEVGCYLLLLMVAWRSSDNSLPDSDEDMARYCRVSLRRWKTRIRPRLEPFFKVEIGHTWRQKRLDAERNYVVNKRKQQSAAGTASALKRQETAPTDVAPPLQREGQPKGNETSTPIPIKKEEKNPPYPPAMEMKDIWNEICGKAGLAEVKKMPSGRSSSLNKRLYEDFHSSLDEWRAYCQRIADSPFLTGNNDRGWKGEIDWVLKPANLAKIVEGKYDDATAQANGSGEPYMGEYEYDLREDYKLLRTWGATGHWEPWWGPKPGEKGCNKINADVLALYGPGGSKELRTED